MTTVWSRVVATGSYLPEKRLTNADLARMVDTSDTWIRERTGILERRIAAPGETTSDLALQAGSQALVAAGLSPRELDLILVATTTPDLVFPATAALVQHKIGASKSAIPAFDIQAVCSGFIYALAVADSFIRSEKARNILVIGAETMSRIVDWTDRSTCILFGDGAGAALLRADKGEKGAVLSTHLHADGSQAGLLRTDGGVSKGRAPGLAPEITGYGLVQMRGNEVYKRAVKALEEIVDETLAAHSLKKGDIDWLVPHQANLRIIHSTAKRLKMNMQHVVVTLDRHGNTSAASVPMALDEAVRDGRIQPGQLVLLEAFGGGFTWGSALIRW